MWNTDREFVASEWPESEEISDESYIAYMSTAHAMCAAYAPALPEGEGIPDSWLLAEIFQARDIWAVSQAGNRDAIGPDGFPMPVTRLNFLARDILRPRTSPASRMRSL